MPLIEVKNLHKTFFAKDVETKVLHGIDLAINKGELIAIIGPSGSGKSTLLHIIGLLDELTSGTYKLEGRSVSDLSSIEQARIRNKMMGFVFQSFNLLPRMSVYENVKLPLLYSKKKESTWKELTLKSIKAVGLEHRIDHESTKLSGGEKQRVAIARALVNSPEVLFADEPTGNLDTKTGHKIMEILVNLNQKEGQTVIVITHDQNIARQAHRIVHIVDGKIVSDKKRK